MVGTAQQIQQAFLVVFARALQRHQAGLQLALEFGGIKTGAEQVAPGQLVDDARVLQQITRGPLGRTEQALPANIEAEAAFLGACLIDNRVMEDLPVPLTPDHFFEPIHGRIFERIAQVTGNNMLANPVTLKPYFEADEAMRALGGPGYLAQLTGSGASLIGARDFARQIYDLALLRELVSVGRTLVERATDTSEALDPQAQIEEANALPNLD